MGKLDGKVALVTGASRGIGRAIAIALAHEGADLVLAARNADGLKQTEAAIVECGSAAEAVPTDVTSEEQIEALFARTMERFGRLDILVNNAGIFENGPIDELSAETWDRVMATNLRAPFLCTRAALRIMKKQRGGRIINIGSISAQRVRENNAPYSSAKFGLVGLTHTTALEGREYGVTCGCLHPGVTGDPNSLAERPDDLPMMPYEGVADAVVLMACQPPDVNILEIIQLPKDQPYLGRG
jgi:NAD(P)-dependent dehydrogenase (short-subunit alcohol dehydrogenase family)